MVHHDSRDYDEAASAAARQGRVQMEAIIEKGRASAEAVVAHIQSNVIRDKVSPANRLRLIAQDDGSFHLATVEPQFGGYRYTPGEDDNPIHPHAFGQLMGKTGVGLGMDFVNTVREEAATEAWGDRLIERAVNDILEHRQKGRHLLRVDGDSNKVKGFLSDKFKRLDSRPLVDSFMQMCVTTGLLPMEGVGSETKCRLRAVLPRVFEPIDNEPMIFGLEFGNSDYGDGGMVLNLWAMRVWCTNLAIAQKGLRQIHLGRQIPDDLELSAEAYRKDTEFMQLAMRDVGHTLIGPGPVHKMLEAVKGASQKEIRDGASIDNLLRGLSKSEAVKVRDLYEGPDVVNIPPGETVYRLSNAVSFFAQTPGLGADRRLELQEKAGELLAAKDVVKVREV